MTIDVYTATGTKKGTATLPKTLFEAPISQALMHQALVRQQNNRRSPIAHVKTRGEVSGSTRKLFSQKGTGRARRGPIRSPILRGGSKAFGPRNIRNFTKDMPRKMRRKALFSCLSLQAQNNNIIGLENYPETIKTKDAHKLLEKLPVNVGRKILFVIPEKHQALSLSMRNIPGIKVVTASHISPEDVLGSHSIVFLVDALKKAEEVFGGAIERGKAKEEAPKKEEKTEKPATKSKTPSKSSTTSKAA